MAQQYYYDNSGFLPPISEVDHEECNRVIVIHLYEIMDEGKWPIFCRKRRRILVVAAVAGQQ